jgi:uncharacterized paraquat-inducible protein A
MNETPRLLAARAGNSRYEGSACRRCGTTQRYVQNANCCRCHNELAKKRAYAKRILLREIIKKARENQ